MRNHLVLASLRPTVLWLLTLALAAGPATAVVAQTTVARPVCTCQNLESLQQEYQNAVYLEGYMRSLAEHLKAVEVKQTGLNTSSNSDPDGGNMVHATSAHERDIWEATKLKLPFPKVKGYTGPKEVSLPPGDCKQSSADLKALAEGSPCEAIADMALAHELAHSDLCIKMGVDVYWGRLPSEIALEEAGMYKIQAANLKAELRRVMDVSDLRLVGEFRYTIDSETNNITDEITYDSGDLSLASQGGDRWTMSGTGETVTTVVLQGPEAVCKSSPARQEFSVSLRSDGLTADVEVTGHLAKDVTLVCNADLSFPNYGGEFGSFRADRLPVKMGDTPFPTENDWLLSAIIGAAAAGGASMTTVQNTILRLTCEGQ